MSFKISGNQATENAQLAKEPIFNADKLNNIPMI